MKHFNKKIKDVKEISFNRCEIDSAASEDLAIALLSIKNLNRVSVFSPVYDTPIELIAVSNFFRKFNDGNIPYSERIKMIAQIQRGINTDENEDDLEF